MSRPMRIRTTPPPAPVTIPREVSLRDDLLDENTIADYDLGDSDIAEVRTFPALRALSGLNAGKTWRMESGAIIIGRGDEATITLADESVSRRHCEIQLGVEGHPLLRDLDSTNGTRVNAEPIDDHPVRLHEGDHIQLGSSVVLRYSCLGELEEALENSLYLSAVCDPLTGAYNRRYLLDRFGQEFTWARRHRRPLCLAVLDLDHFKRVNDTFGHEAGDRVLTRVADLMHQEIRHEDLLARYGGEEFVLLMRETHLRQAVAVMERIRDRIGAHFFKDERESGSEAAELSVTVSIGVASSSDLGIESPLDLFVRADQLLYRAKSRGRDRVASSLPGA